MPCYNINYKKNGLVNKILDDFTQVLFVHWIPFVYRSARDACE